jgi:uridine kinase
MIPRMTKISEIVDSIIAKSKSSSSPACNLVAISGIDGSGKSTIATQLVDTLNSTNLNTVLFTIDLWHYPQDVRFSQENPGDHFYQNAFRFDTLFNSVIEPLKQTRSIDVEVDLLDFLKDSYYKHRFNYKNVDVILLEGIFILKQDLRHHYDLSFWIECSFETALKRAILRNQEGLYEQELIADYETIYFPAERVHLTKDNPQAFVDGILLND